MMKRFVVGYCWQQGDDDVVDMVTSYFVDEKLKSVVVAELLVVVEEAVVSLQLLIPLLGQALVNASCLVQDGKMLVLQSM